MSKKNLLPYRGKRKPLFFALSSGLVLVFLIGALYILFRTPQGELPDIVLPPVSPGPAESSLYPSGGAPSVSPDAFTTPMIRLEIDRTNVQDILAGLDRPSAYTSVWQVEYIWPGGSSKTERRMFVRDGYTKIEKYDAQNNLTQHQIDGPEHTFIWSPGGPHSTYARGGINAEDEAALAAYETIGTLEPEEILFAEYLVWDDVPCAYIESQQNSSFYVECWWVSLESGLLIRAEKKRDGEVKYRCRLQSYEITSPGDEYFRLPNNQLAMDAV